MSIYFCACACSALTCRMQVDLVKKWENGFIMDPFAAASEKPSGPLGKS